MPAREHTLVIPRKNLSGGLRGITAASTPPIQAFALLFQYVPDCGLDFLPVVQVSRAAVPRPPTFPAAIYTGEIESPGGVGLEIRHHAFRSCVSGNDCVDMVRSDVDGQQLPTPVATYLPNGPEGNRASAAAQRIRALLEGSLIDPVSPGVLTKVRSARNVVHPVNRAARITVQPRSVTSPGDQVGQRRTWLIFGAVSSSLSAHES